MGLPRGQQKVIGLRLCAKYTTFFTLDRMNIAPVSCRINLLYEISCISTEASYQKLAAAVITDVTVVLSLIWQDLNNYL